jgi:hypothetical protein
VAPNNLLVEGPADLIYLNLASQVLQHENLIGLRDEWTIVPVGGADKVATFVSLLGAQGLNLAVFMDVSSGDQQRFQTILKNKLMVKKNLLTVGAVLDRDEADIEDLFSVDAYLKLVSRSYSNELGGKAIAIADLKDASPRLVKRLESYFSDKGINNGKFNHYKPAYDLMSNPNWHMELFDKGTKINFEKAIASLNGLLDLGAKDAAKRELPVKHFKGRDRGRAAESVV